MTLERKQAELNFDSMRQNAQSIVEASGDILTIDYSAIDRVLVPALQSFQKEMVSAHKEEINLMPLERELGAVLFYNVVNFCFKDPVSKHEYEYRSGDKTYKRSTALFTAMKESEKDWNHLRLVSVMGSDQWEQMTQLSISNPLYLGDERGKRIRGFAKHLLDLGNNTVADFIKSTNFDAINMVASLSESGYFTDEFLKRAQLTVRMLNDVFEKRAFVGFKNTYKLTSPADYRLPQVFYNMGVINLGPNLLQKLSKEEQIESDGREERALRAASVVTVEYLSDKMDISEAEADKLLWNLSQKMAKEGKLPIPHMLVATDKY